MLLDYLTPEPLKPNSSVCLLLVSRLTLRVQVPNNHMPTQNLHYNYNYPKLKYLTIGYLDPLGKVRSMGL